MVFENLQTKDYLYIFKRIVKYTQRKTGNRDYIWPINPKILHMAPYQKGLPISEIVLRNLSV